MTKKVFISYSHKDELFKESLEEHLALLKRNQVITTWNDRKIIAGQNWGTEISQNLKESELVLLLISPSFLASDYCFDIEVQHAMEMHTNGQAQLIPILIRPCDWTACELSKFQAVPKDALPITKWDNQDEAWLDAINNIKRHIECFKSSPNRPITGTNIDVTGTEKNEVTPSEGVLDWMEDIEIILTHHKVDKVKLADIYVPLDLEKLQDSKTKEIEIVNSETVFAENGKYLIAGEEQQGKTSLLKNLYKQFLKKSVVPIYLDATLINQSDIQRYLIEALKKQYIDLSLNQYLAMQNKILLLDNLDAIGLNPKYRGVFLAKANEMFKDIIITCNASFIFVTPEIGDLNDFKKYDLLELGHIKRAEIVEKWVSLGREESIADNDLYEECDELKSRLDTIIRKNIVPAKPIYILMLLQMFEVYAQQNLDLSSHGHCYQQLIYQAFDHAKIPKKEVDKYLNVLTELAWVIHKNGGFINQNNLEIFFKEYGEIYLPVDRAVIIATLMSNSILEERDFKTQFKYPYFYYFFSAKKIAETFSKNEETRAEVSKLIANLHREDYANILVFVTHHTKDSWVLNEIQKALSLLFSQQNPATLSKDQLGFMDSFIAKIPELVMEWREISKERIIHNENLDRIEKSKYEENSENINFLANINRTFKGLDIAGQIIRNRHATLTRNELSELASQGIFTGLRFLDYFIHISDTAKSEVIKVVELKLREHPNLSNAEVQDSAKDVFVHMTYGVINGVLKKIASAIGSEKASEIYLGIEKTTPTPAIYLLNQAIELHYKRNLDIDVISKTAIKLKDNPVCTRILKEMVIQHTYMFPVGYKAKQKIAELLNISVHNQRLMDRRKIGKG